MRPANAYNDSTIHGFWGHITGPAIPPAFDAQKFSDNNFYIGFLNGGDDDRITLAASSANYTQNTWQHYAFTWVSGGTSRLYRNAVEIGTKTGTTVRNLAVNWEWGRQNLVNYFAGNIDDCLIYKRELYVSDLCTIFAAGRGGWATPRRRRIYAPQAAATGNRRRRFLVGAA
jgi:hypothetical protein